MTEILSFSCLSLFLVTANGGHLGMPNCKKKKKKKKKKKSKGLHTRNILAPTWIDFIRWFLQYRHFRVNAAFSNGPWQPSLQVYFYLILKQLNVRIILTQVKSKSIRRLLSFSCSVLFLVTANGGHFGLPNCENSKRLHTRNILVQNWINFN